MDKILAISLFIVGLAMVTLVFPEGPVALITVVVCSGVTVFLLKQYSAEDSETLINLFLLALVLRLAFGIILQAFELQTFFGGDAETYDVNGNRLLEIWYGQAPLDDLLSVIAMDKSGSGWGMNHLVAIIYFFTGRNSFAAQSFCAVIGAATVPMVYLCAQQLFANRRVAKVSAMLVTLYPAFIIWSGQLLKDGLIVFLLVLAVTMVLKLQQKLNYVYIVLLIFSLFGIFALRFYVFYMAAIAVVGSFIVGHSNSSKTFARIAVLLVMGLGLTYLGVVQNASQDLEEYGNLERLQASRSYQAAVDSGYGKDLDVSTTEGAISALPVGLVYLLLAPFPWEIKNFRQAITLPEILLWWSSIPLLISGLIYTIRHRLRASLAVLIFTMMLTFAYAIFQGNVGTAYRQRTQIQVFFFMFIAVGWTLIQERRENSTALRVAKRQPAGKTVKASI